VALTFTIIIPTKNRCESLTHLFDSLKKLRGFTRIAPEIIVADNGSSDQTLDLLQTEKSRFPGCFKILQVPTQGKGAVLNEAIRLARSEVLAFIDDDVTVDKLWLEEIESFFQRANAHLIGQGVIRLSNLISGDQEIRGLLQRYRTVPQLEFDNGVGDLHSLNGANFAVRCVVFDRIGLFDERLGPGASGTSEDVDLAQRILKANMKIVYMQRAVVYHHVDRGRLTEAYFKKAHRRQGASRFLMHKRSSAEIVFNLLRASGQYGYYSLIEQRAGPLPGQRPHLSLSWDAGGQEKSDRAPPNARPPRPVEPILIDQHEFATPRTRRTLTLAMGVLCS
jgi:glycosyltransferase involved in cell wall biosynthesis